MPARKCHYAGKKGLYGLWRARTIQGKRPPPCPWTIGPSAGSFCDAQPVFPERAAADLWCHKGCPFPFQDISMGQGLYQPLQFVLVEYGQTQAILACTDLSMDVKDIIGAYACRFKIGAMFREMEQALGGLCHYFWTHAVPKLDRYRRKGSADPLAQVKDRCQQQRIIKTLKATEGYAMFAVSPWGSSSSCAWNIRMISRYRASGICAHHPVRSCRKPV